MHVCKFQINTTQVLAWFRNQDKWPTAMETRIYDLYGSP
eukprot:Gb_10507 [translate_table: standard]